MKMSAFSLGEKLIHVVPNERGFSKEKTDNLSVRMVIVAKPLEDGVTAMSHDQMPIYRGVDIKVELSLKDL